MRKNCFQFKGVFSCQGQVSAKQGLLVLTGGCFSHQPNWLVKPTPTSYACWFPSCFALRCGLPWALGQPTVKIAILALVTVLALWVLGRSRAKTTHIEAPESQLQPPPPERATAEEIQAYFANAERLRFQPIEETVACIGEWDNYDDWDWGRIVYDWRRPTIRVMVLTQSGSIRKILLLDPADDSRFGIELKVLLDEPFAIESKN